MLGNGDSRFPAPAAKIQLRKPRIHLEIPCSSQDSHRVRQSNVQFLLPILLIETKCRSCWDTEWKLWRATQCKHWRCNRSNSTLVSTWLFLGFVPATLDWITGPSQQSAQWLRVKLECSKSRIYQKQGHAQRLPEMSAFLLGLSLSQPCNASIPSQL